VYKKVSSALELEPLTALDDKAAFYAQHALALLERRASGVPALKLLFENNQTLYRRK
jgi:hypothetical protein